jgi:hypothetical protein
MESRAALDPWAFPCLPLGFALLLAGGEEVRDCEGASAERGEGQSDELKVFS